MEPSKEPIAVRLTRLNRQILGKVTSGGSNNFNKRTIDREALLDALTALYDECNDDPVKKCDELVQVFVDKYRSTLAELRRTRVCIADFETLQVIGRGNFGDVHMVREKQTGDVYAVKQIRKEAAARRGTSAEDERAVLAACSPWLPRLQYAFQDNTNLYLVMELCSGGDLASLLSRSHAPLSERDAAFYVAEIAHALKALHNLGFVHRDLKPHNVLLDRCGHVKLTDFGSCARLSEGSTTSLPAATADYVAPELLAAVDCARRHTVCLACCRGVQPTSITACDYWSLGVIAFELVTLQRPFSSDDDDSIAKILSNIQKYESSSSPSPPFPPAPAPPSEAWRGLVAGLLRVPASRRYSYLDTLQHAALRHLSPHSIRDQAPPWVPSLRGPEDAAYFPAAPRAAAPPRAAPFRPRAPFNGQLPFVGFSYVAPDDSEDSMSTGFNASHDCTAIDLATFKSAEKLAAMRGREIASLQSKLAMAEATAGAETERTRRAAEDEAERLRSRLQAEITALSLQNKRLERQLEIDKEERMALERNIQELNSSNKDRNNAELRKAQSTIAELECDRNIQQKERERLLAKVEDLSAQCERNLAAADSARAQQRHYKESMAKERALRRQTLTGYTSECRESGARLAAAEAGAAEQARARGDAEAKLARAELAAKSLQIELDEARRELATVQESLSEKKRVSDASTEELKQVQMQLTQERVRSSTLLAQVQELQREVTEARRRETAAEEQSERTEARLQERLRDAEARAADAIHENARHRDKVNTLEQFVRQLEREVGALEARRVPAAPVPAAVPSAARAPAASPSSAAVACDAHSDTESVDEHAHTHAHGQVTLLKEQLAKAEAQLQARTEEMAALRQEARAANLARWRKEREFNDQEVTVKTTARELKRLEERLATAAELRRAADQKASALQTELDALKPDFERISRDLEATKEKLVKLQKEHEIATTEVDRSRNDIRKLKCELQYSEKRRLRAEEHEERGARERAQLTDDAHAARADALELQQNNRALQDACSLLEEQLTDLERLSDLHEDKNKELEKEVQSLTQELSVRTSKLQEAERLSSERGSQLLTLDSLYQTVLNQSTQALEQIQILKDRLETRETRLCELEGIAGALEQEKESLQAALSRSHRQTMALQEETAVLRTRAQEHHAKAMQLQADLDTAQEEIAAAKEAADSAAAWWRTRETKADATLRQQAKLIDFLQSKVEDSKYKKCSLSTKLFGRSPARGAASPPLRRANRELREEVDRLKKKLATSGKENISYTTKAPSARPETSPRPQLKSINGVRSIDTPDGAQNTNELKIIWRDGSSTVAKQARCVDRSLVFARDGSELRARLVSTAVANLPHNEAQRSFTIKIENSDVTQSEGTVVCSSIEQRAQWVSRLSPPAAAPALTPSLAGYAPAPLVVADESVTAALYLSNDALALGTATGLRSLRGGVRLELDRDPVSGAVASVATCASRVVLLVRRGEGGGGAGAAAVLHGALAALSSALRRAPSLHPALCLQRVHLPDGSAPALVQTISSDTTDGPILAVAAGRRVFLFRFDAATAEFRLSRSLTVDRPPFALLLTTQALYIAGERPLKINLPSGALESFAMENPTVAAAAKKHTTPKQLLLIRDNPIEILICYSECGIFVGENGKKTRTEDPKWPIAVSNWAYVNPFLYLVGKDGITIIYITEDAYRAPPCTCDTESIASSDGCTQETTFNLKLKDPQYLGSTPNGIIIRSQVGSEYVVAVVEGMAAFRSVGASVESLATLSDAQGSTASLATSTDGSPTEVTSESSRNESLRASIESVDKPSTRFLADIRQRAEELRQKNSQHSVTPQDVIKAIMTTEVELKRLSRGRKSPSTISEGSEESDTSAEAPNIVKSPADLCAEMFTKQVKFQKNVS